MFVYVYIRVCVCVYKPLIAVILDVRTNKLIIYPKLSSYSQIIIATINSLPKLDSNTVITK